MSKNRFNFRVWNSEDKLFVEDQASNCFLKWNGELVCDWGWHNFKEDKRIMPDMITPPKAIIEQCTGLKDSNGKDIFEGDIVSLRDMVLSIVYKDGAYCFRQEDSDYPDFYYCWPLAQGKDYQNCTIIGNIHQNSEVLR